MWSQKLYLIELHSQDAEPPCRRSQEVLPHSFDHTQTSMWWISLCTSFLAWLVLRCFMYEKCFNIIVSDPKSYYHAHHDPIWQDSMDEEYNSLQKNATWELVSLPHGRKLVQWKWVYRTKVSRNGSTYKYKYGLVEKLFSQVQGVYYTKTFALVEKNGLYSASFSHFCI